MPHLEWIGKRAVAQHHREVPYRLLQRHSSLSFGDEAAGNLLIHGDNLPALKALLPYYSDQVKCVFIDPPYNTGEERWMYNDNVNSPELRSWLGKIVGGDADDLSRHDKWLCMMYPRLALMHSLLRRDGAIVICIDDNELHHLRALLDEIFGATNHVATICWQKRTSPDARINLGPAHDYLVVYAKNKAALKPTLNRIPLSSDRATSYRNPDEDSRGPWASSDITGQTGHATAEQYYTIITPSGNSYEPPPGRCWAMSQATFLELQRDNRIWFGRRGSARPRQKLFLRESEGTTAWTWWTKEEVGHNQEATKELLDLVSPTDRQFETPKPIRLVSRVLQLFTGRDSIVLDAFAGSGTTGHAVLKQNLADNGARRCILIEMTDTVFETITHVRLRKAVEGYVGLRSGESFAALGSGFEVATIGQQLFDGAGRIHHDVKFGALAAHVFFTETGLPLPKSRTHSPLLGTVNNTSIYLLYNGILGDKRKTGGNVLTSSILAKLPKTEGSRVVYGEACLLSRARLQRENILFKQIPYQLRTT